MIGRGFDSHRLHQASIQINRFADLPAILPLAIGYLVVIVGERLYPHVTDWNRSHDDVATDAAWWLSINSVGLALRPLAVIVAVPVGGWLSARFHIVDIVLLNLGFTIPLIALGADARVISLWLVASAIHGLFQHANMSIRCGPLNWIFSMAELHRWHHSKMERESNTNYGSNLILWDIVFGTRFLPADREAPKKIGIAGLSAFPMTWWRQLLSPFRWSSIKEASDRR